MGELSDLIFTTKCRACEQQHEWHYDRRENCKWEQFAKAMQDLIDHPKMYQCDECNRFTVQDVVAYSTPMDDMTDGF